MAIIHIGPIALGLMGLVLVILIGNASDNPIGFARLTMWLYGIGFALFLIPKLSLVRQGIRISFGSVRMSPWHRRMYRTGYCLMGLGLVFTLALVIAGG